MKRNYWSFWESVLLVIGFAGLSCSLALAAGADIAGIPHVYKKVAGRDLKLYVVNPPDHKTSDRKPAIVFFHGGGFVTGTPSQFNEQAKYLASRGMVAVLVEYRFASKKKAAELPIVCIEDAKSAMRWVRSHSVALGIDPDKIVSAGGSAGGYLAAIVGMLDGNDDPQDDLKISSKSCAMALFNPLLDLQPYAPESGAMADKVRELSPINEISQDDPPAIVFFGTEDKLGNCVGDFKAKMEKVSVRCDVKLYQGQVRWTPLSTPFFV